MVEGEGFEPPKAEPADLQSAPVDRLGTPPMGKDCVYISVYCQYCNTRYEFLEQTLFTLIRNIALVF